MIPAIAVAAIAAAGAIHSLTKKSEPKVIVISPLTDKKLVIMQIKNLKKISKDLDKRITKEMRKSNVNKACNLAMKKVEIDRKIIQLQALLS